MAFCWIGFAWSVMNYNKNNKLQIIQGNLEPSVHYSNCCDLWTITGYYYYEYHRRPVLEKEPVCCVLQEDKTFTAKKNPKKHSAAQGVLSQLCNSLGPGNAQETPTQPGSSQSSFTLPVQGLERQHPIAG